MGCNSSKTTKETNKGRKDPAKINAYHAKARQQMYGEMRDDDWTGGIAGQRAAVRPEMKTKKTSKERKDPAKVNTYHAKARQQMYGERRDDEWTGGIAGQRAAVRPKMEMKKEEKKTNKGRKQPGKVDIYHAKARQQIYGEMRDDDWTSGIAGQRAAVRPGMGMKTQGNKSRGRFSVE